ncbi:hypothetical protein [Nocardia sp. NPDC060249]|uniref:hypothetical protein n=1 Tax=Nocardia sp. NPDC060249 TaxID=3347082 RepID=UPI00365183D1
MASEFSSLSGHARRSIEQTIGGGRSSGLVADEPAPTPTAGVAEPSTLSPCVDGSLAHRTAGALNF